MCIDTVSLPNESRYGDISIYCCISTTGSQQLPSDVEPQPLASCYPVSHLVNYKHLPKVV